MQKEKEEWVSKVKNKKTKKDLNQESRPKGQIHTQEKKLLF